MNEKTKSKVLDYLTKKHGSKALAYHMEKYFRFTLDHAQKDGMIKIVTAENGDEYVKLLILLLGSLAVFLEVNFFFSPSILLQKDRLLLLVLDLVGAFRLPPVALL